MLGKRFGRNGPYLSAQCTQLSFNQTLAKNLIDAVGLQGKTGVF